MELVEGFGLQRVGEFAFVKDSKSKVWCVLDLSSICYPYTRDVHRVLGVTASAAKSAIMGAPCISVRKYIVDNAAHDGSGNKSDKRTTLLLDIAFLHALLEKRAQTRALWRGKHFSDIATLQVRIFITAFPFPFRSPPPHAFAHPLRPLVIYDLATTCPHLKGPQGSKVFCFVALRLHAEPLGGDSREHSGCQWRFKRTAAQQGRACCVELPSTCAAASVTVLCVELHTLSGSGCCTVHYTVRHCFRCSKSAFGASSWWGRSCHGYKPQRRDHRRGHY